MFGYHGRMENLSIQIWSDIACPWCWIGKRSLEAALKEFEGEVVLRWRAFELNPGAPKAAPETVDYAERLAAKYGTSHQQGREFIERMVTAGASRGLELRFDRIRPSNTFDAHRLLAFAHEQGLQTELKEGLFTAYLHEGKSVSDHETLTRVATGCGLDTNTTRAVLASDQFTNEVREDETNAQRLGISGVPCFVFGDSRLAVSGAQPPDVLLDAMRQATADS